MIIFHNPGLIPVDGFRLMGASVKAAGAFGRFGSGLKYGVATILRGGGQITVWRGSQRITFETRSVEMKGETFEEVVLVNPGAELVEDCRVPLGFTTAFGKDWEPWMALRELACNARDEGGDFNQVHADDVAGWDFTRPDGPEETVIIVDWPALDEAMTGGERVFAEGELLHEERGVRVLPGPSEYLYHRGVRVWKLPRPSVFTYDIVREVRLTEDRTVQYGFWVEADVRNMILATTDRSIIAAAVSAGAKTWEGGFDWAGSQWEPTAPGSDWLEEVSVIREKDSALSKSAKDVLLEHSAYKTTTQFVGGSYDSPTGTFGDAAAALEDLGIDLTEVNTFVAQELPGGATSTIKGGSVYVTKELLEEGSRFTVAREMLRRFLELKSGGSHDALLALVVPLILDQSYDLKREREVEEARAEGMRPTMVEAFLGLHPVKAKPDLVDDIPF